MIRRGVSWVLWASVSAGLAIAAAVLHASETRYPDHPNPQRMLYLTSGKTAGRLMLSFDSIAADLYWIRTIQHYGRDRKSQRQTGRFEQLQPLLDLTTTLDPHFMIAYRFGAIFLSMPPPHGPGRADQAVALLEKGLKHNPLRWQFAHDVGFIHYWYTGDYTLAAAWFDRAARLPNAPKWIGPLAATTKAQGGNREGARQMLVELLTGSSEVYIRNAAERGLRQLKALDTIDQLNDLIKKFHDARGHYPADWKELLGATPFDDTGAPFIYDAALHATKLSPASALQPLPVPIR